MAALLADQPQSKASLGEWVPDVFVGLLSFDNPEDAPPGFADQMMAAHREPEGGPTRARDDISDAAGHLDLDEDLAEAMSRVPNTTKPTALDNGSVAWNVYMGSAVVTVVRAPLVERVPPSVQFRSPLVREIALSEDLSASLNSLNAEEYLNKFYWREGTVWMEYVFLVVDFDAELFHGSLARFATLADHFDTMFRGRYGGILVGHDREAVFDA